MPAIHKLPETLINKIAAGEVVERPASVVKELVENALDAGATEIEIALSDGGKKSILVRDNGCGMERADLRLSVERHTTSKIANLDDLFSIHTLGFRGEALASIASVSKTTVTSKKRGSSEAATELKVEGGEIVSEKETGHPEGTTVLVKYLFYQVPARLKFLKSAETEVGHVVDTVTRLSLAHPSVAFRVTHEDRKLILTHGSTSSPCPNSDTLSLSKGGGGFEIGDRIRDLFGEETARGVFDLAGGGEGVETFGVIGHPSLARSQNRNIYLFVNGRPVRDKLLMHAVMEGHRNFLMHGRFPFVVLFAKLRPDLVDVNVHPAKAEVRFAQSQLVHRIVLDAVRQTLSKHPGQAPVIPATSGSPGLSSRPRAESESRDPVSVASETDAGSEKSAGHQLLDSRSSVLRMAGMTGSGFTRGGDDRLATVEFGKTPFSQVQYLGQLLGTYLVCQTDGKLVLIDQHAAHERMNFEKLSRALAAGSVPSQGLLVPINFDLKPSEAEILKNYLTELESFGLEINFFGGNTFIVRSVPELFLNRVDVKSLVLDLIGDVLEAGHLTSLKEKLHDVLARMACHSSVRAGDRFSREETASLLADFEAAKTAAFCPHGRPVSVEIDRHQLEKWFKRVV